MTVYLGEIATFINGRAFKPSEWISSGVPIIRIQNLTDSDKPFNYFYGNCDNKYLITKGDILISWSGSLGVYEWEDQDALLNQHIYKVVFNKREIDKSYFKYIVGNVLKRVETYIHGSTMKHITKKDFDNLKIPLPQIDAQKKIAEILDKADTLRQQDKKIIEKYDQLTQSVFLDMFGDPYNNQKTFKLGTIRNLLSEVRYGTSLKANSFGKYPYLRMNNITYEGYLDLGDMKYIDLSESVKEKYIVRKGDILFNRTNSKELVGKTGVYDKNNEMVIAGYIIRSRVNNDANPYFIWGYLNSKHGKKTLQNICKNIVGMANINAQEFQDIPILNPPIELQNKFAEIVKKIGKQKQLAQKSLEKSEHLFQSLLQRAFKGELV